ncbi:hypothetical protein [Paraburkholderia sp. J67]|uniref:hypothetical protein n=1 Tax=Paraburkholderia sp. J67 TaxID=2805435 RepID=UPI0039F5DFE4
MGTLSLTVELSFRRQNRRHTLEWKRSVVEQTFEPGAAVARENNIDANPVRMALRPRARYADVIPLLVAAKVVGWKLELYNFPDIRLHRWLRRGVHDHDVRSAQVAISRHVLFPATCIR